MNIENKKERDEKILIKQPTLKELQKIFFQEGLENPQNNAKSYAVNKEEIGKFLGIMKSTFKCINCGNCCRECAKHGISLKDDEYDRICNYLGISHSEFKRRFKHKFKRDYLLLQGEKCCPFYNEDEKKCNIYEIKPSVCSQYPFTGANIKQIGEKIYFIPCTFCYPYLLGLYYAFEEMPLKDEIRKKIDSLPKEVKEKLKEESKKMIDLKIKEGLDKLKRDESF